MSIIEQIRSEVLRLIKECDGPGSQYGFGKMGACNRILNFLDTLQEQPVEWSEEDEEMLEYVIGDVNDIKQLYKTQKAKDIADKEIAWLKSLRPQPKPEQSVCEGLEKEINRYLEPIHTADIQFEPFTQMTKCARHFAQWQKEQMMKEAVETWILEGSMFEPEFFKRKVIIIKED